MSTQTQTIDLDNIPDDVLERALEKRKTDQRKAEIKAKEMYEKDRNDMVEKLSQRAVNINAQMAVFKSDATADLNAFYERMKEYGGIKSDHKGSFTIWDAEKTKAVEYCNHKVYGYNEHGAAAAAKINEYLEQTVKKRDQKAYKMISALLAKSRNDDYDPNNIQKLYTMEKEIGHPLFTAGVELFKEAWTEKSTSHYIRFYQVNSEGEKVNVQLNWSSLKAKEVS